MLANFGFCKGLESPAFLPTVCLMILVTSLGHINLLLGAKLAVYNFSLRMNFNSEHRSNKTSLKLK